MLLERFVLPHVETVSWSELRIVMIGLWQLDLLDAMLAVQQDLDLGIIVLGDPILQQLSVH